MLLKSFWTWSKVRFKLQTEGTDHEKVSISVQPVRNNWLRVIFKNLYQDFKYLTLIWLSVMEPDVAIKMDITIDKGWGYVSAGGKCYQNLICPVGTIPTDAISTPYQKIKYSIENLIVEQKNRLWKVDFLKSNRWLHPSLRMPWWKGLRLIFITSCFFSDVITIEPEEAVVQPESYDEESSYGAAPQDQAYRHGSFSFEPLTAPKAAEGYFRGFGFLSLKRTDEVPQPS